MSAVSSVLLEDHFLCSICLDVFTDPVSTPCGHNYCQKCISKQWDVVVPCECPYCKKTFCIRPELQVNTLISEMLSLFRRSVQQRAGSSSSEQQAAKPGGVSCDVCTGSKLKALKSCPVCLSSFCETHLTASRLKRHQLIDPVENLQRRMCPNHDEQPELFCKADHVTSDVPVEEKCAGKTAEVENDEDELQQMLQEKRRKIEEFKGFLKFSRENADREETENFHDFEKLKEAVERKHAEVTKLIKAKHRAAEKQAEDFIRELEEEISELKRRRSEGLHVLQTGPSMMRDWTAVRVRPPIHGRDLRAQIAQLAETLKKELKRLLTKAELKMVQQFAVDVTLDPETANPCLVLSADGKRVHHADDRKNLPDNPQRFTSRPHVLAKQSVSSGRFYFEVQVKGKSDWILGVSKETIDRKGLVTVSPENGLWTLRLRNEHEYCVPTDPPVRLLMKSKPGRVGVFVDYEEGLISFYDVDAAALMYSFTGCSFTEKLLPFFSPGFNQAGRNSAPLSLSRQPN